MKYVIHTDGGSRGNPGPGAIGVCVLVDAHVVHEIAEYIGAVTNNEAEYKALLSSIKWVVANQTDLQEVVWKLDSKLVVEQIQKHWKIKEGRLQVFANECWELLSKLNVQYSFVYVPREENKCADLLVNQALDAR